MKVLGAAACYLLTHIIACDNKGKYRDRCRQIRGIEYLILIQEALELPSTPNRPWESAVSEGLKPECPGLIAHHE